MEKSVEREIVDNMLQDNTSLGQNDIAFLKRVYSTSSDFYMNRLKSIGFENSGHVIDAGCGFGQWSIPLAGLNRKVTAIDIQTTRLTVLSGLVQRLAVGNLAIAAGSLEKLPVHDESADAIFCYGVIFCTDWMRALREFSRVLKPGGKLYLTANGIGWYLHLWVNRPNATADYDPRETAALALGNTLSYEQDGPRGAGNVIVEPDQMREGSESAGLRVLKIGGEGTLCAEGREYTPGSLFKSEFFGLPGVYEMLAAKSSRQKP